MEIYLCYGISLLILSVLLAVLLKRENKRTADRLVIGAVALEILSEAAWAYNELTRSMWTIASQSIGNMEIQQFVLRNISYLLMGGVFYLLTLSFASRSGINLRKTKRVYLYLIPWLFQLGLLIVNAFTGCVFSISFVEAYVEQRLQFLLYVTPCIYFVLSAVWNWRVNRTYLPAFLILAFTRITSCFAPFTSFHTTVTLILFTIELCYLCFCSEKRGVMYQIGGIMLLFFSLLTVLTGNLITSSSFSAFLKSSGDKYISMIRDNLIPLDAFEPRSECINIWINHPDEMTDVSRTQSPREEALRKRLLEIAPEGYLQISNELFQTLDWDQKTYLSRMLHYVCHSLFFSSKDEQHVDDLYLYVAEGPKKGLVLLNGKTEEGLFQNEMLDYEEIERNCRNYSEVVSTEGVSWIWTNAGGLLSKEYGVHVDYYIDGGPLIKGYCEIPINEMYNSMAFIVGFSNRSYLLMGFASLYVLVFLYFVLLRPLTVFQESIDGYRQNKDVKKVAESVSAIHSRNEIQDLALDFSDLTRDIAGYTEEVSRLTGERERISSELCLATNIQKSALPVDFPDCSEFSLYALMEPAKEVGGDFYDFFPIGKDYLGLVIADVSDKGVPAALFMMASKLRINARAMAGGTPGEILTEVNAQICAENKTKMFVTVWLGILNLQTGELSCANAGHEYPIIRGQDGLFHLYRDKHGLVLGGMQGIRYKTYSLQLNPGDAVFVYTDGVPEARNAQDEFYRTDRLETVLNRAPELHPRELLKAVRTDVAKFVQDAPQFDDITMMCVTWKGASVSGLQDSSMAAD